MHSALTHGTAVKEKDAGKCSFCRCAQFNRRSVGEFESRLIIRQVEPGAVTSEVCLVLDEKILAGDDIDARVEPDLGGAGDLQSIAVDAG